MTRAAVYLIALLTFSIESMARPQLGPIYPQRLRITEPAIFFAAPNGSDINNNCRIETSPCTPSGAYTQAKINYDCMNPIGGCYIRFAPGIYTWPAGGAAQSVIYAAGAYVGAYSCQMSGDVTRRSNGTYDFSHCRDPNTTIVDLPNGGVGLAFKDGVIGIISCMTFRG